MIARFWWGGDGEEEEVALVEVGKFVSIQEGMWHLAFMILKLLIKNAR